MRPAARRLGRLLDGDFAINPVRMGVNVVANWASPIFIVC